MDVHHWWTCACVLNLHSTGCAYEGCGPTQSWMQIVDSVKSYALNPVEYTENQYVLMNSVRCVQTGMPSVHLVRCVHQCTNVVHTLYTCTKCGAGLLNAHNVKCVQPTWWINSISCVEKVSWVYTCWMCTMCLLDVHNVECVYQPVCWMHTMLDVYSQSVEQHWMCKIGMLDKQYWLFKNVMLNVYNWYICDINHTESVHLACCMHVHRVVNIVGTK